MENTNAAKKMISETRERIDGLELLLENLKKRRERLMHENSLE